MTRATAAIFNDTTITSHVGCAAVINELTFQLGVRGIEVLFFWPVGEDWNPYRERLNRALSAVDVMIVNGEGSIHNSRLRPRARWLLQLSDLATEKNIPVFLINCSIHNIEAQLAENLNGFNAIYVREGTTKNYLHSMGVSSTVVPDLAISYARRNFAGKPADPQEGAELRGLVTDSVDQDTSRKLKFFSKRQTYEYRTMYAETMLERRCRKFIRKLSQLTFGTTPATSSMNRVDIDATRWITEMLYHDFVVTGRFHTVAFSIALELPFLAVQSNTTKISDMLQDCGLEKGRVVEVENLKRLLSEEIRGYQTYSLNEKAALSRYNSLSVGRFDAMFDALSFAALRHASG